MTTTEAPSSCLSSAVSAKNQASPPKATGICHSLPCSIAYSGRAPIQSSSFQPQPLKDDAVQTAMFRGRGLLAHHPATPVQGRVVQQNQTTATTLEKFDGYVEWVHTHQPEFLQTNRNSRSRTAQEWMTVATALHAPVPVEATNTTT